MVHRQNTERGSVIKLGEEAVFSIASKKGLYGGCGLGGVWIHIKGSTCHIKEKPKLKE